MSTKRTSGEIVTAFEAKGCKVIVRDLGMSYRAGGEILILAPGIPEEMTGGVKITKADFVGFDGTGYDGRGRSYEVWTVTPGEFVPCTGAEFANAPEDQRVMFGNESRSCSNVLRFCNKQSLASTGLADFGSAFAALGL